MRDRRRGWGWGLIGACTAPGRGAILGALACASVALGVLVLALIANSGSLGAAPTGVLVGILGVLVLPLLALTSERAAAGSRRARPSVGMTARLHGVSSRRGVRARHARAGDARGRASEGARGAA